MKYYYFTLIFITIFIFLFILNYNSANLLSGQAIQGSTEYIFFYGTLRRNKHNYWKIKDSNVIEYIGNGITANKYSFVINYKTKRFPCVTDQQFNIPKVKIKGDLYKIKNNISLLDKIEFLRNLDLIEYRYDRKSIPILYNGQILQSYIYIIKDLIIKDVKKNLYPNGNKKWLYVKNGDYITI